MPRRRKVTCEEAARILDDLLERAQPDLVPEQLSLVPVVEGRRLLVQRLESGTLRFSARDVWWTAWRVFGLGAQAARLARFVRDSRRCNWDRALAFEVLQVLESPIAEDLVEDLDSDSLLELNERTMTTTLLEALAHPERAETIAVTLSRMSEEKRNLAFAGMERARIACGVPAATVWSHVLANDALTQLHASIRKILVAEGGIDSEALLTWCRDRTTDVESRRTLQESLMRARSRERDEPLFDGDCPLFLSSCDGHNRFAIVALCPAPDTSWHLVELVLTAGLGFVDGRTTPRATPEEAEERLSFWTECLGCTFTRIHRGTAAAFVLEHYENCHAQREGIENSVLAGAGMIERAGRGTVEGMPEVSSGELPSPFELETLLSTPPYDQTWFFDEEDFGPADMSPRDLDTLPRTEVLERLESFGTHHRLHRCALHMARFYELAGDKTRAGRFGAAGEHAADNGLARNPLGLAIYARTLARHKRSDAAPPTTRRPKHRELDVEPD